MNRYLKEKSDEMRQKEYLAEKKGKMFFWSDYYDLAALAVGAGLVWVGYRVNVNIEIFLALTAGYVFGAGILKRRVKKWQREKIVQMICYEQGWERFKAELEKTEGERIAARIEEILTKGGMKKEADGIWWKEKYRLLVVMQEEDWDLAVQSRENLLIIASEEEKKMRHKLKAKPGGKVILGNFKDLYDLSLKCGLTALPKINENKKAEKMVEINGIMFVYGIGLLVLANFSRYFYVYFGGGIILLSVFLVGYMKKGTISEVVLLKKAMNFSKSKV